jgi:phosphate transport system permease protein
MLDRIATKAAPGMGIPSKPLTRKRRYPGERIIEALLVVAALISVATTIGIVVALVGPTVRFLREVSIVEFLTSTRWTPTFADKHYGVLPLLVATLVATVVAVAVAVPLGLGTAIYLAEYAGERTRRALKPVLEVLAGIPTVVYGFIALFALNPILRDIWPGQQKPAFQNLLVAGLVMGFMIIPTVASICEDSMNAVPRSLREGAYALAASPMQVATRVVVPAAISGIVAAFVLGISRALGETMIVTIAGGLTSDRITVNPIEAAATMTAYIANVSSGDIPVDSLDYTTVFAVGALLFGFTFLLNSISIRMVRKFRQAYE